MAASKLQQELTLKLGHFIAWNLCCNGGTFFDRSQGIGVRVEIIPAGAKRPNLTLKLAQLGAAAPDCYEIPREMIKLLRQTNSESTEIICRRPEHRYLGDERSRRLGGVSRNDVELGVHILVAVTCAQPREADGLAWMIYAFVRLELTDPDRGPYPYVLLGDPADANVVELAAHNGHQSHEVNVT